MTSARDLTRAIASLNPVSVSGRYYRVTSEARLHRALDGSPAGGRWGPVGGFPVIYLGDSYEGVVIETHRHVADTAEDKVAPPKKLGLITVDVDVTDIVDLTAASARFAAGLSDPAIVYSEPQDPETGAAYLACQQVAQAAHQLGRHGILVPSASHRGNTLALFAENLTEAERPTPVGGAAVWEAMPADPRRLRIVEPMRSDD
ncbi:RES domain-containing protein [Nocardioides ginsengisegetis]|uniref:RES domain-containing protein n=1 Tax=Nocardioides ginsengisegetis TaxID=661491 RepID=A0A7W3PB49_9ACTN|nr:RES family NAD+ phosphorylase [Nocardioides ginsengisegetis]MBA8805455.1 RES domain-containing protein [Nocardioides ginsengisegetis]